MDTEKNPIRSSNPKAVLRLFWEHARKQKTLGIIAVVMAVFGTLIALVPPLLYKRLLDTLSSTGGVPTDAAADALLSIIAILAGVFLVNWIIWRIQEYAAIRFEARVMSSLVNFGFSRMIHHSYEFFSGNFVGSLVRKLTRLPRSFESLFDLFMYNVFGVLVSLIGVPFIIAQRSVLLAAGFLGFAVVLITFHIIIARWKQKYNLAATAEDSKLTGVVSDAVANETAIKFFTAESHESGHIGDATKNLERARVTSWHINNLINLVQAAFMSITEIALLLVAVHLWREGTITVGDFALLQGYFIVSMQQLWGFNRTIRGIYESFADATEMVDIIDMPYGVLDPLCPEDLQFQRGEIIFDDVSFAFNKTRTVLHHFNLTINSAEKIALVGPSGAGKTTITKLLLRFYDVDAGKITIDGQNIAHITQGDLRSVMAFVPQEPALFHRTLMENIRYGRKDATDEEVVEASKKARCHEFITNLSDGYNTLVGERGIKLSGGERQRVAIARAILKNAPILVLDEATSSLDSESEHLIQEALEELMEGKTVIVIAHRLSTIQRMDRIVVVEEGKVSDMGTHQELINRPGVYQKLWTLQAGGFIAE